MRDAAAKDGVRVLYQEDDAPTGTCAVLINGHHRSLVANLSAANNFRPAHLEKPENWSVIEAAKTYYVSGFFLTVSPDSIKKVAEHAATNNKVKYLSTKLYIMIIRF
jgi:adenosine kinase